MAPSSSSRVLAFLVLALLCLEKGGSFTSVPTSLLSARRVCAFGGQNCGSAGARSRSLKFFDDRAKRYDPPVCRGISGSGRHFLAARGPASEGGSEGTKSAVKDHLSSLPPLPLPPLHYVNSIGDIDTLTAYASKYNITLSKTARDTRDIAVLKKDVRDGFRKLLRRTAVDRLIVQASPMPYNQRPPSSGDNDEDLYDNNAFLSYSTNSSMSGKDGVKNSTTATGKLHPTLLPMLKRGKIRRSSDKSSMNVAKTEREKDMDMLYSSLYTSRSMNVDASSNYTTMSRQAVDGEQRDGTTANGRVLLKPPDLGLSVKSLYYQAVSLDKTGYPLQSYKTLSRIVEINDGRNLPTEGKVWCRMSRLLHDDGLVDEAVGVLNRALINCKDNKASISYITHSLAMIHLKHSDYDTARMLWERDDGNHCVNKFHAWGRMEVKLNNHQKALDVINEGLGRFSDNHRLYHARGGLHREMGEFNKAEIDYLSGLNVCKNAWNEAFLHTALATLYTDWDMVELARSSARDGIRCNHNHAEGWIAASMIEEIDGNVHAARDLYKRGWKVMLSTKKLGKWIQFVQQYCRFEEVQGNKDEASRIYSRAVEIWKDDWMLWMHWGKLEGDNLNELKAREIFQIALQKCRGRSLTPYRVAAELEMDLMQYDRARDIFENGFKVWREDNKQGGKRGTGELKKFLSISGMENDFTGSIQKKTSSSSSSSIHSSQSQYATLSTLTPLLHHWGICEWQIGRFDKAKKLFKQAVKCTQGEGGSNKIRAWVYLTMSRFESSSPNGSLSRSSLYACRSALSDPTISEVWLNWGEVLSKQGELKLSEECKKKGYELYVLEEGMEKGLSKRDAAGNPGSEYDHVAKRAYPLKRLFNKSPWHSTVDERWIVQGLDF